VRASSWIGKGCASTGLAAKELKRLPDPQDSETLHRKQALSIAQFLGVRFGFGHRERITAAATQVSGNPNPRLIQAGTAQSSHGSVARAAIRTKAEQQAGDKLHTRFSAKIQVADAWMMRSFELPTEQPPNAARHLKCSWPS
jgi:hypothetical protein